MAEKSTRRRNQELISTIGRNIRKHRELNGLSIAQLAYLMETDPKHIQRLELGTTNPSVTTVGLAAEKLDIDIAELFINNKGPE